MENSVYLPAAREGSRGGNLSLDFSGSLCSFIREGIDGTRDAPFQIRHCLAIFSRVDCVL